MVTITCYSGNGGDPALDDAQLFGNPPKPPAPSTHPIAALFEKITGTSYKDSRGWSLIKNDGYCNKLSYHPSIANLNIGLRTLYFLLTGESLPQSQDDPKEDYASFVTEGRKIVHSLEERLKRPILFLEIGAGVALNTMQAGDLGMHAYAIELRPQLVDIAEKMLALGKSSGVFAADIPVHIHRGNYFPKTVLKEFRDHPSYILDNPYAAQQKDVYDVMGKNLDTFDIIYSFAWPGSEDTIPFRQFLGNHTKSGTIWQDVNTVQMTNDATGVKFFPTSDWRSQSIARQGFGKQKRGHDNATDRTV